MRKSGPWWARLFQMAWTADIAVCVGTLLIVALMFEWPSKQTMAEPPKGVQQLSPRGEIAMHVMQAMVTRAADIQDDGRNISRFAKLSVSYADALLAELNPPRQAKARDPRRDDMTQRPGESDADYWARVDAHTAAVLKGDY